MSDLGKSHPDEPYFGLPEAACLDRCRGPHDQLPAGILMDCGIWRPRLQRLPKVALMH